MLYQSQSQHGYGFPTPPNPSCGSLFAPVREPAGALGTEFARLALGKPDSDDEDADSEAERQQVPCGVGHETCEPLMSTFGKNDLTGGLKLLQVCTG